MLLSLLLAAVPAFPGAEGAGMWTTGGRAGAVYRVTNTNASGPGSLADAISRPDRFIVFTISGTIDLRGRDLVMAQPNITIAGQTAPGEGITIRNGGIRVTAGNIVLRHLRMRRGMIKKGNMGDALGIKGEFEDVIADHISTAWATDENLTLTNANRVTAQYAIVAEALDYFNPPQTPPRHAFGSLFGSSFDDGRMTIHHSLYAHNRLRNARTTGGGRVPPVLDFRNNVIYDSKEATSHTGSQAVHANWIANYYKDGPSTEREASQAVFAFHGSERYRLYLEGNWVEGDAARSADNWKAVHWGRRGKTLVTADAVRADRAFDTPLVTTQTAADAYETVLAEAGAILPSRDAIDARIVNDVRQGTGAVINTEADLRQPWPVNYSLPAPLDADTDGLPDAWEKQFDVSDPRADDDGDGYTNIEEYTNNTNPVGGAAPVVYVSAAVSRAYRATGSPGAFRLWRAGSTGEPLTVTYMLAGKAGSLVIPAGARYAELPVPPGAGDRRVLSLNPAARYTIGCPSAALVAIEDGGPPPAVRLADVDAEGGATVEDRAWAQRVQARHEVDREVKIKERNRKLADPNFKTKKPSQK